VKKDEKSTTDDATGADPKPGSTSAPAPAPAPSRKKSAIDREIDRWFQEQIHGSPVSRHTPSYNHLRQAIDDLKVRLASATKE